MTNAYDSNKKFFVVALITKGRMVGWFINRKSFIFTGGLNRPPFKVEFDPLQTYMPEFNNGKNVFG